MAEKTKKLSFFEKIKKFFKDIKAELKKITWFSTEQTLKSTAIVCIMVIVFAIVIGLLDYGFATLMNLLGGILA